MTTLLSFVVMIGNYCGVCEIDFNVVCFRQHLSKQMVLWESPRPIVITRTSQDSVYVYTIAMIT